MIRLSYLSYYRRPSQHESTLCASPCSCGCPVGQLRSAGPQWHTCCSLQMLISVLSENAGTAPWPSHGSASHAPDHNAAGSLSTLDSGPVAQYLANATPRTCHRRLAVPWVGAATGTHVRNDVPTPQLFRKRFR